MKAPDICPECDVEAIRVEAGCWTCLGCGLQGCYGGAA